MNGEPDTLMRFPAVEWPALKATIIYEDFASGLRARGFAEELATQVGCASPLADSIWRSDLLESWPIAHAAARAAADSDYIIVSLRGDRVLPLAARQWIETHLDGADLRDEVLIVLSDSGQGKSRVLEGTRHYFRSVCAAKGATFFAHTVASPAQPASSESCDENQAAAFVPAEHHWLPALRATSAP